MADDFEEAKRLCGLTNGFRSDVVLVCIDLEQVDMGKHKGQVSEVGISTLDLRGLMGVPKANVYYANHMTRYIESHHFRVDEYKGHRNRYPPGCAGKFDWVSVSAPFSLPRN